VRVDQITGSIVDAAMKLHTALGPGLLESVYEKCLKHELTKRGAQGGISDLGPGRLRLH